MNKQKIFEIVSSLGFILIWSITIYRKYFIGQFFSNIQTPREWIHRNSINITAMGELEQGYLIRSVLQSRLKMVK